MISVIQALRVCPSFRNMFAPQDNEPNQLKRELFRLFDIVEGASGYKKRPVRPEETLQFKRLLINLGLKTTMNGAYLEEPFLRFLLHAINVPEIEYLQTKKQKHKRGQLLKLIVDKSKTEKSLQELIKEQKIAFSGPKKVPEFLPISIDRPIEKSYRSHKVAVTSPITPSPTITIPIGSDGAKARYSLVSIVIGRDDTGHAYCYTVESQNSWVEYNDSKVIQHAQPETKRRRSDSSLTAYQDACKHSEILIYQFTGY